jgi:hypothetical protein
MPIGGNLQCLTHRCNCAHNAFQHAYGAITFHFAWLTLMVKRIMAANPQNPISHKQTLVGATANFIPNPFHIT